jgi:hypothetical protein
MLLITLKYKAKSLRIIKRTPSIRVEEQQIVIQMEITILAIINPNQIKVFSHSKTTKKAIRHQSKQMILLDNHQHS